ncbi:proteasome subunit alpha type-2-like [Drosophila busckii]|uniref:proteasome subunit alpha type-2-like n=1 Tax=Drosophila busckii TaxID=30019 RepID=UPI00083F24B5|nr:proteasome subunit alpha type-2-like [Drosophila busckii]
MSNAEFCDYSLTTFDCNGRLRQVDYALAMVNRNAPSVGIVGCDSVLLASIKRDCTPLMEPETLLNMQCLNKKLGIVYAGHEPDYRVMGNYALKTVAAFDAAHHEIISIQKLVTSVSQLMQENTQTVGTRPFAVSLLTCGHQRGAAQLYETLPGGDFRTYQCAAIGKAAEKRRQFMINKHKWSLDLDGCMNLALDALQKDYNGILTAPMLQIGYANCAGFAELSTDEITKILQKYYLWE